MSTQLKKLARSALAHAGIDRLAISLHARDALVLVYHAILSEPKGEPFRYHHTVAEFEAHLDWLASRYIPAGLGDFARWLRGDWQPRKPLVLVTFDDGYLNNATNAAPVLSRKGFPAVFFVASEYIGREEILWPDMVFAHVMALINPSVDDPDGRPRAVPESLETRQPLALSIVEMCKNCNDAKRREYLTYLTEEVRVDPLRDAEAQRFMSWDDVRALSSAGFEIGSHTATHPILSNVSAEQLRLELVESRAAIEARTGQACTALAYPNGRARDIGDIVVDAAANAGYDFAFTVSNRWCSRTSNALQLDRISPPGHSDLQTFILHASGCRQLLAR
jgi:peptidoglycan/xylan/chitin deacetylase (PgdA/CDA1 family)